MDNGHLAVQSDSGNSISLSSAEGTNDDVTCDGRSSCSLEAVDHSSEEVDHSSVSASTTDDGGNVEETCDEVVELPVEPCPLCGQVPCD
jgi:hypothetical protein